MQYSLCEGLQYRQLGREFLVFSNLSRETLLVHENAFDVIQYLSRHKSPQTFLSVCEAFVDVQDHLTSEEQNFIKITLEQFTGLGVIECIP